MLPVSILFKPTAQNSLPDSSTAPGRPDWALLHQQTDRAPFHKEIRISDGKFLSF